MPKLCGKWLNYLTNSLKMFKFTQRFWEMAKIFGKWLRYVVHGLSICGSAYVANDLNI